MYERSIVSAFRHLPFSASLKKATQKTGIRNRQVRNSTEFSTLLARHPFSIIFADRTFAKEIPLSTSTEFCGYVALVVEPKDLGYALSLQSAGKIRDWLVFPFDDTQVSSLFVRGSAYLHQASELAAIRQTASSAIREDATLLRTGKWATEADVWIDRVKDGREPLLLVGEAGSGKHLLARLIHYSSSRASALFAVLRCQTEDSDNLAKEIFGSKSALASTGTVFFDKVERLSRRLQQRLTTALRMGFFIPSEGNDRIPIQARVIFSVQEQAPLQKDFAHMLRRNTLRIPSLRERPGDLPLIVKAVFAKIKRRHGVRPEGISDRAMELLSKHSWPGNVRELEGVLWASSVLAGKNNISLRYLTPFLSNGASAISDEEKAIEEVIQDRLSALFRRFGVQHLQDLHTLILGKVERTLLSQVLEQCDNSQVKAAQILGINRNTLRRKLNGYK